LPSFGDDFWYAGGQMTYRVLGLSWSKGLRSKIDQANTLGSN
jgi:hypothetical protein